MEIRVVFLREITPDWKSRLISLYLREAYSHVGIVCTYKGIPNILFHAVNPKVIVTELEEYLKTHEIAYDYKLNVDVNPHYIDGYIDGCHGKPYSSAQIYFNAILKLFSIRGIQNDNSKVICSELVFDFLARCGIQLEGKVDWIDPRELQSKLVEYLSNNES